MQSLYLMSGHYCNARMDTLCFYLLLINLFLLADYDALPVL